jgi:5-hydroxyisourate hydrolase-like protein (transthyretin family)
MSPDIEDGVLERVAVNRRKLVRDVVLGTAFAVPAIASFDMRSLTAFAANCLAPNQTLTAQDDRFRIKYLQFDQRSQNGVLRVRLEVHDVDTNRNVSSKDLKVKLRKIKPAPSANVNLPQKFSFHRDGSRHYKLKLDTSHWAPGNYELFFTVGADRTRFKVFAVVGNC